MSSNHVEGGGRHNGRMIATLWNFVFLNVKFIISIVNGILIIPLYLYYIDSAMYGSWLATGSILTWITIVDPGVGDVILQKVAQCIGQDNKKEIGIIIMSGIIISIGLFLIAILVGYLLSTYITDIANIKVENRKDIIASFRIALWGTAFSLLADTFRNIVLAYQKTKIHGVLLNLMISLSILLNVILLIMGYGVFALAYTSLFRGLSILLFAFILTISLVRKNKIHLKFDISYLSSFSKVFAYTFSSRLFETISSNIDLILVSRFLGPQSVTILDLSRRPLKIVSGLANNVTISALPSLSHLYGSGEKLKMELVIMQIWTIILWISGFIIGGFVLFNFSLTTNWVGEKFWIGHSNNIIMCISFLLLSVGYNLSNVTYSMGDMKNNSLINVIRSVTYLVLLFVLSQSMGMPGVLLSYMLPILIMIFYYPKKIIRLAELSKDSRREILRESLLTLSIVGACIFISFWFEMKFSWLELLPLCLLYLIVYLLLLITLSKRFKSQFVSFRGIITSKLLTWTKPGYRF